MPWTSGEQTVPYSTGEQVGSWINFGLGLTAIGLVGQHQFTSGKRGWDYLISGVRAVEEYSPGRVFRTFQFSHLLSPLEQASRQYRFISPAVLSSLRTTTTGLTYLEHLSRLAGRDITATNILSQGIRFERGQLLTGRTGGDLLLRYAGIIRSPTGAQQQFQHGYARSLKGGSLFGGTIEDELNLTKKTFGQRIQTIGLGGRTTEEALFFTGGQTRLQAAKRYLSGYGVTLAERINQLARAPFELPVLKEIFNRIPGVSRLKLGTIPSSGLKTIGKFTAKLGILGYAGYLSYQTIDYWARKSKALDNTIFAEGITAGIGTAWTRSQVATSKVAETFGAHDYREWQEEIAPGSTELSKLAAFPIIGALTGSGIGYIQRLGVLRRLRGEGLSLGQASTAAAMRGSMFKQALYGTKIPSDLLAVADDRSIRAVQQLTRESLEGISGRIAKKLPRWLGKMTPGGLKILGGAAIGAALVLPFLPGALIPSKRSKELEAIYSGKQLIPIRKGRWWEMGRSPYEGTRIDRFRQHWYPRMLARAKERSIWGEDEPSPLKRWWIENTSYELEQRHYYDRPYPVSGTFGQDIPFLGPLISATIGRLIKPPRLMHQEEWMKTGPGGETLTLQSPLRYGQQDLSELGEAEEGSPISPYGLKGTIGRQIYNMQEMIGLPGFTMTAIKEAITGTPDVFDQEMQLEAASRMYGAEREFWDLELGGMLGTNELLRRMFPHRRRQIPTYNPLRNTMPEWLSGPGEKGPDLLHGDPYCVSGSTLIETINGLVKAEDIRVNDFIKTHKGHWQQISKIVQRRVGSEEKVFRIRTTSLAALPLIVSEEHPLWMENGWVEAKDVKVGDYVGYPVPSSHCLVSDDDLVDLSLFVDLPYTQDHIYIQGTQEYADCVWHLENIQVEFKRGQLKDLLDKKGWNRKSVENAQRGIRYKTINRIPRYINPHSKEWGIISGYWLSEGSCSEYTLSFAFHQAEDEYIRELDDAFYRLFNRRGDKYNNNQVYQGRLSKGCSYNINCKALAQIIPKIWGKLFDKKHLWPQWKGSILETLRCLFNGDGSYYFDQGKSRLSLKLENIGLLWSVRQILLSFGFVAYIIENQIVIRGQAAKDCALFLGCKYYTTSDSSRTVRHTRIKNNYVWMRVFSKQEVAEEAVYGFQVDGDNSFCAAGIATHNSTIPEGELRLPGRGYEILHPELEGVAPADYPAIHRYAILCLDKMTIIPTSNDLKRVCEIRKGDLVVGEDGKYHTVIDTLVSKGSKKSMSIKTVYNFEPLICSSVHKISVMNKKGEYTEKYAKDINTSDYLLFPKGRFSDENINICLGDYVDVSDITIRYCNGSYLAHAKGSQKDIPFNITPDYFFGFVCGLYLSEGGVEKNRITWTFNINERETLGSFIRIFAKVLGLGYFAREINTNSYQIQINNKLLSRFFGETFGYQCYTHFIGIDYLNYPKEFSQGIFDGYFNGDGYYATTATTITGRASSVSYPLISQLRLVGLNLGIVGGINPRKGKYKGKRAYRLDIQRRDLDKVKIYNPHLLYEPKYKSSVSKKFNFETDQYIAIRVKKVKHLEYNTVWYDLVLDGIDNVHKFMTSQGIVHNSDVAPYTDKYKEALYGVRAAMSRKQLSKEEIEWFKEIQQQVKQKKIRREFQDYKFLKKKGTPIQELLAADNEAKKEESGPSWFERTIGKYWEALSHGAETPLEYLTPLSPASKLVHTRTAVEDYERTQLWGTLNAFWGHPIRDFLKPTITAAAHSVGWEGIPEEIQERRDLEEYFDILKYVKYTKLQREAAVDGDMARAKEFAGKRRETLFGLDPFSRNYTHIYRALPRRDRDYFKAFSAANLEDRAKIVKMVPENEQALMIAQWKLKDAADLQKAIKKGLLTEEQVEASKIAIDEMYKERETEGFPKNKALWVQYISTRLPGESYPDWYRRVYLLPEALEGKNLPGPDWTGFCIPDSELIATTTGYKTSGNIEVGATTPYGKVIQKYSRFVDEEIVVLKSVASNLPTKATSNHLISVCRPRQCKSKRTIGYSENNNDRCVPRKNKLCLECSSDPQLYVEWIAIETCKRNDYVVFERPQLTQEINTLDLLQYLPISDKRLKYNDNYIWWYYNNQRNRIRRYISCDERFGFLLGLYLAEGHIGIRSNRQPKCVCLTHNLQERYLANRFAVLINEIFEARGSISIYERYRDTGNSLNTQVNNPLLAMIFKKLCGDSCYTKALSDWNIINQYLAVGLLGGALAGDGVKSEDRRIGLGVCSSGFALLVRWLLMAFGFVPIYREYKYNNNRRHDQYFVEVSVNPEILITACISADFAQVKTLSEIIRYPDRFSDEYYIYFRIQSVDKEHYKGLVNDFTIEPKQQYLTLGAMLHNSPQVDLEDIKLKIVQQEGKNMYDYDLWPDRQRIVARRPFIEQAAEELTEEELSINEVRGRIAQILNNNGITPQQITVNEVVGGDANEVDLDLQEDRTTDIMKVYRRGGF